MLHKVREAKKGLRGKSAKSCSMSQENQVGLEEGVGQKEGKGGGHRGGGEEGG